MYSEDFFSRNAHLRRSRKLETKSETDDYLQSQCIEDTSVANYKSILFFLNKTDVLQFMISMHTTNSFSTILLLLSDIYCRCKIKSHHDNILFDSSTEKSLCKLSERTWGSEVKYKDVHVWDCAETSKSASNSFRFATRIDFRSVVM